MYVSRLFVWTHDHESGLDGWLLQRRESYRLCGFGPAENFTPVEAGRTVAHDVLEHFTPPGQDGYLVNELMALGAVTWTRLERGHFSNERGIGDSRDTPDVLSMLIADSIRDSWHNDGNREDVPPCPYRHHPDEWLESLKPAIEQRLMSRLRDEIVGFYDAEHAGEELDDQLPRVFDAVRWVEHGYHLTHRRWFKGRTPQMSWTKRDMQYRVDELFWEIARAVDRVAPCEKEEGRMMRVGFTLRYFQVAVRTERLPDTY